MEVKCPKCLKIFKANKKDEKILLTAIKNESKKLVFVECSICLKDSYVDPLNLLEIETKPSDKIMDCPICKDGIIVHIKNETEDFYGCGECGNVWKEINDIK